MIYQVDFEKEDGTILVTDFVESGTTAEELTLEIGDEIEERDFERFPSLGKALGIRPEPASLSIEDIFTWEVTPDPRIPPLPRVNRSWIVSYTVPVHRIVHVSAPTEKEATNQVYHRQLTRDELWSEVEDSDNIVYHEIVKTSTGKKQ